MRQKDIALLKQIGELQAVAARMVKDNLKVGQDEFDECLIKHLDFKVKNPEDCTTAGIISAYKRGFPTKYHSIMVNALQGVIQELDDRRGKLLKDKQQETMLFNIIFDILDKANSVIQFMSNFDELFISDNFKSPETVKDFDPRFVYALNKSFGAFKTLSKNDIYFLCIHQRKDLRDKARAVLNQYMDLLPLQIGQNYSNEITAEWMQARKQFLFKRKKEEISVSDEWRIFFEKYNKLKSLAEINDSNQKNSENIPKKMCQKLIIVLFLKIIWPQKGHTNTSFKPEDIDALLVFKNCLSTKNQLLLLNEFKDIFE